MAAIKNPGGKKLVIVESPAKAKTINKILGSDFIVKASMGHVRDLPLRKLGVNIAQGFRPDYEVVKGREKILHELELAAKDSSVVYLAPDPDREGEAIAWHLQKTLSRKLPEDQFFRVTYNEITPRAVREAFANPRAINQCLVDAQQARRVLDRIVGYKVSPLLWSRIQRGLSAGRVQSVALRLVCEREDAIRNFVPVVFWIVGAMVRKRVSPVDAFPIRLARINDEKADIKSAGQAEEILKDLDDRTLRVSKVIRRELSRKPFPPYITSTLQQAASRCFDYSPARTMSIAQKLYEGMELGEGPVGLITYMRTDSVALAAEAVQACREFIHAGYGREYLPDQPHFYRSRASSQGAHEAIRPTDVNRTPESLAGRISPDEHKLYSLIWQRFVACQMAPAVIEQRTVEIEAVPPPPKTSTYLFRATASQVTFPGYMKVSGALEKSAKEKEAAEGDEEGEVLERLPEMAEGELLQKIEWLNERKETQPPNRYSEASLVRALEENGVGRPSTYASILATLQQRKYVVKEKKALVPTPLGDQVFRLLIANLNDLFDVNFTATMESALDEVEKGSVEWTKMLADFHARFLVWMAAAKGPPASMDKIDRLLLLLGKVQNWPPEAEGPRKGYNEHRFVESIRKQRGSAKREFSERQLQVLARIALRYKEQIPEVESVLTELGLTVAAGPEVPPPGPDVLRKLELLRNVKVADPQERKGRIFDERVFLTSIEQRVRGNRGLSPAQALVLDRLLMKYSEQIPGFAALKDELGLKAPAAGETVADCMPLLDAAAGIKEWQSGGRKGRRMVDDQSFYDSLRRQFATKRALSVKQVAALKRMLSKYRDQVPGFDDLMERYKHVAVLKPRGAKGAAEAGPKG